MRLLTGIFEIARSLSLCIAGLAAIILLMAAGSLTMIWTGGYETLNSMPLLNWMLDSPFVHSYWLLLCLACLALLAVNTLLCSADSILKKTPTLGILMKLSPQVIHGGFLLVLVGHLMSSLDSSRFIAAVAEGDRIRLTDTASARVSDIRLATDDRGRVLHLSAVVTVQEGGRRMDPVTISPNSPAFHGGTGVYLKDARVYPRKAALVEVSRDAGASWAFAGGLLFFAGNILLLALKLRRDAPRQDAGAPEG